MGLSIQRGLGQSVLQFAAGLHTSLVALRCKQGYPLRLAKLRIARRLPMLKRIGLFGVYPGPQGQPTPSHAYGPSALWGGRPSGILADIQL